MDFWVVAAAAGAGCVAKSLQGVSKERVGLNRPLSVGTASEASMSRLEDRRRPEDDDPGCVFRRFVRRHLSGDLSLNGTEEAESREVTDSPSGVDVGDEREDDGCDENHEMYAELSPRNVSLNYRIGRSRRYISRRSDMNLIKPLNSLESCVVSQLYNEHAKMEELLIGSLQNLSSPVMRPFFITDGKRIISRSSYEAPGTWFEAVNPKGKETVVGVSPLPDMGLEWPKKMKRSGKAEHERSVLSNSCHSHKHSFSGGLHDGLLLFLLGISIGVMSTLHSRKREVDKLNDMLKQSENLVQDLQDELEMKDSLTVRELADEICIIQEINDCSVDTKQPVEERRDECGQYGSNEQVLNPGNDSDLSKIEAELEAELERLELNMNASSLERQLSALNEIDPDLTADVVHGELKADTLGAAGESDSNDNANDSSTTHTHDGNYAVSPWELSLRLHELLQSRLEERIEELETALQNSQMRIHHMESEQLKSGSSSTLGSPIEMEKSEAFVQPLQLNLGGDALNAYEACEEFLRMTETEEENPPTTASTSGDATARSYEQILWNQNLRSLGYENDESDTDDEAGKLLIQQILEKTRQGSPVVLNAQRMLFSMDD
ncbi:hypothetical protein QJS04_geneDACA006954 [Acorus gramineus]|uniref:Uncharacterized protein n=1 Tax=Acorus gramineus TaxID=55184 RepID=A0AAV9AV03_ACOGR|nr:hypothetical protein QJS04_geneDACA006954 [Acorus gramineus]